MNNFSFLNYLRPTFFSESINKIDLNYLKRIGIKAVFCDLDNTLIPYFCKIPNNDTNEFIAELKKDFKVYILSNNRKKRVSEFCELLDIDDFFYSCKKPFLTKIKKVIDKYKINPNEVIFIGDQFITDILCANRMNIKSILILPKLDVWKNKQYQNRLIAFIENIIYKSLAKNKGLFNNKYYDEDLVKNYDVI